MIQQFLSNHVPTGGGPNQNTNPSQTLNGTPLPLPPPPRPRLLQPRRRFPRPASVSDRPVIDMVPELAEEIILTARRDPDWCSKGHISRTMEVTAAVSWMSWIHGKKFEVDKVLGRERVNDEGESNGQ
jgi:hypothetical protein